MISNYVVSGMTCQHCVNAISEEVGAIAEVESVDIDLETGKMVVNCQTEPDFADVESAVAEAGDYTVVKA